MRSHAAQHRRQQRLEQVLKRAKARARNGAVWYGTALPEELAPYTWNFHLDAMSVCLILTLDEGMHMGGWFKNPDFNRCWHASLSYKHVDRTPADQNTRLSNEITRILFEDNQRLLWIERPFSEDGKLMDVWHYRLMCDDHWMPLMPRGEVYSKEFTEKGWKSYSEIHGHKPNMIMTP